MGSLQALPVFPRDQNLNSAPFELKFGRNSGLHQSLLSSFGRFFAATDYFELAYIFWLLLFSRSGSCKFQRWNNLMRKNFLLASTGIALLALTVGCSEPIPYDDQMDVLAEDVLLEVAQEEIDASELEQFDAVTAYEPDAVAASEPAPIAELDEPVEQIVIIQQQGDQEPVVIT